MLRIFLDYPYLWSSLAYLLTAALFAAAWPAGRRLLLAVGLLHLPFALGAVLHVPEYWNPRVIWTWLIAPEDLLFSLAVGVESFFLAAWPLRRRLSWTPAPRRSLLRFCAMAGAGLSLLPLLYYACGLRDVMLITLTGYTAVAGAILLLRRELWPLGVNGMLGYAMLYLLQAGAVLHIWPRFTAQWTPGAQLPWAPWGIPGYELVWAAGFGLAWPLFAAYVLGVSLSPRQSHAGAGAPPARV
jgi:hypothetical protein